MNPAASLAVALAWRNQFDGTSGASGMKHSWSSSGSAANRPARSKASSGETLRPEKLTPLLGPNASEPCRVPTAENFVQPMIALRGFSASRANEYLAIDALE
jgi:hypothetical protein